MHKITVSVRQMRCLLSLEDTGIFQVTPTEQVRSKGCPFCGCSELVFSMEQSSTPSVDL